MGFAMLLEGIGGDPQDFYAVAIAALDKRQIPDLEYGEYGEVRFGMGMFSGTDEHVTLLTASDSRHQARILAHRYGPHLYISLGFEWVDGIKMNRFIEKGNFRKLDRVWEACFEHLVERGVREAVGTYLELQQQPVPEGLSPEDVFIVAKG